MAKEKEIKFNPINAVYSSSGFSNISDVRKNIVYDDILDDSLFRPDKEQVRQFSLTGSGSNMQGVFDHNPDDVTELELKLRSGKLDKAEVSQYQHKVKKDYADSKSKLDREIEMSKAEKLNKARQDYLDKATGFKGNDQSKTV